MKLDFKKNFDWSNFKTITKKIYGILLKNMLDRLENLCNLFKNMFQNVAIMLARFDSQLNLT